MGRLWPRVAGVARSADGPARGVARDAARGVAGGVTQPVWEHAAGLPIPPAPPGAAVRDARPSPEEVDLLARLRGGDDAAFSRLFETHWDAVVRLVARLVGDADQAVDLAQEVFVQLYRNPPEADDAPLRAWLYRVAINRGYNALRSERRRRRREAAAARDPITGGAEGASADTLAEAANRAEERDAVRRVLLQLPARQRECLLLRAEGLSYAEIAAALGIAPGSIGTILARAERAFKQAYLAQRGGM